MTDGRYQRLNTTSSGLFSCSQLLKADKHSCSHSDGNTVSSVTTFTADTCLVSLWLASAQLVRLFAVWYLLPVAGPLSFPLTLLPIQFDGHELDFRISRFDVDGSEEEVEGVLQLPFVVTLPPSDDQRLVIVITLHNV